MAQKIPGKVKRMTLSGSLSLSEGVRKAKSEAEVHKLGTKTLSQTLLRLRRMSRDDEELNISLVKPMCSAEWDPSCIVEYMYVDRRVLVPPDEPRELCRHKGYLDKLPVGESKPSFVKGWKRRYFKVKEGYLSYFKTREDSKPLGVLSLENATTTLEDDILTVVDSKRRILSLRGSTMDLYIWKRAISVEAVVPTITPPLAAMPGPSNTVVIDIGSCSVRAGYATDNTYPQLFFPTVFAVDVMTKEITGIGLDALVPERRETSKIVYPWRHSARMDKQVKKGEYLYCLVKFVFGQLRVNPAEVSVVVALSLHATDEDKQMIGEVLFDQVGVQAVLVQDQEILALYSYGALSGIVVNIGDRTSVMSVIDGCAVEGSGFQLPLGGGTVTENLKRFSTEKGIRYFSDTEAYIMRYVKEEIGYVSQDIDTDLRMCRECPAQYTRGVNMDNFYLPDHRKLISLDSSLFQASEGHFNSTVWGNDVPSLHKLVWQSLQASPIDERRDLANHIYLSGAGTLLVGLPERLEKELNKLVPSGYSVKIHASEKRGHAAFIGAGVLASLQNFHNACVSNSEWYSLGIRSFSKS